MYFNSASMLFGCCLHGCNMTPTALDVASAFQVRREREWMAMAKGKQCVS
jgi:hypothetical protein